MDNMQAFTLFHYHLLTSMRSTNAKILNITKTNKMRKLFDGGGLFLQNQKRTFLITGFLLLQQT